MVIWWVEGEYLFNGSKTYQGKLINFATKGHCHLCFEGIHNMKDGGVQCTFLYDDGTKCKRWEHYRCAPMLCAFKRVNEGFPGFICSRHYKAKSEIFNPSNGYSYEYIRQKCQVRKFQRNNRLPIAGHIGPDKLINRWNYANAIKIHHNRIHTVECGTPESNEKPILLQYSDGLKDRYDKIGYFTNDEQIRDTNLEDETIEIWNADNSTTFKHCKFRYKNNKLSTGVEVAYNAFTTDTLENMRNTIVPLVTPGNDTFEKYRDDETTYHIDYAPVKESLLKLFPDLSKEEINLLINRIKFYIHKGYKFGKQMSSKTQELFNSSIQNVGDVIPCLDSIHDRVQEIWPNHDRTKYQNAQINNYLCEKVNIRKRSISKKLAIGNHNDNPLIKGANEYYGEYHFDAPAYIVGIQGRGTLSCGFHKQQIIHDPTQHYRILPGSILRMEGISWWNLLHCVGEASIEPGHRVIFILRPYHPQYLAKVAETAENVTNSSRRPYRGSNHNR